MKLIFGANGKLGTDFKELLDSIGEKYIASDKDEIDITNGDFLRAYVQTMHQNYKIDTIINCAAYNYVDRAETEKELCYKLNAEAPATLANIAAEIGANYITYSSDFVFNGLLTSYLYGDTTGYTEEDITDFEELKQGLFVSPGYTTENLFFFSARLKSDSIKPKELSLDEGEELVVEWINVKDIIEKSNDMKTLFGVTYFSK